MLKQTVFVFIAILGIFLVYCSADNSADSEDITAPKFTKTEAQLSSSGTTFGVRLFKQLVQEDPDKNVFLSPLSVSAALGMTYNGAGGDTREQMKQTLGFMGLTDAEINQSYQALFAYLTELDPDVQMKIANSIWYNSRYTFKTDFIATDQQYFDAEVTPLNFGDDTAADVINNWVAQSTNGKIPSIVAKPIDPMMAMYLINAIYFKGTWTYRFADSLTTDDYFIPRSGDRQKIRMMHLQTDMSYYQNPDLQMVDLPYGKDKYRMTIILPNAETDINQFVLALEPEMISGWIVGLSTKEGQLALPRFKIEYEKSLNTALQILGILNAFDPRKADFTGMSDNLELAISEVKHKSFVEVNEQGTEAAAVTSIGIRVTSVGPGPFVMNVNRPFLFLIRDSDTSTILFIGRVTGLS